MYKDIVLVLNFFLYLFFGSPIERNYQADTVTESVLAGYIPI